MASQLHAGLNGQGFDPHTTLGVRASASHDEVHKAYVALDKAHKVLLGRAPTQAEPIYTSCPRA